MLKCWALTLQTYWFCLRILSRAYIDNVALDIQACARGGYTPPAAAVGICFGGGIPPLLLLQYEICGGGGIPPPAAAAVSFSQPRGVYPPRRKSLEIAAAAVGGGGIPPPRPLPDISGAAYGMYLEALLAIDG